jgi:hypothetical protein
MNSCAFETVDSQSRFGGCDYEVDHSLLSLLTMFSQELARPTRQHHLLGKLLGQESDLDWQHARLDEPR